MRRRGRRPVVAANDGMDTRIVASKVKKIVGFNIQIVVSTFVVLSTVVGALLWVRGECETMLDVHSQHPHGSTAQAIEALRKDADEKFQSVHEEIHEVQIEQAAHRVLMSVHMDVLKRVESKIDKMGKGE